MNDSIWTFVFEIANFVALAAVLGWLFFKPVRQALEVRQAKARQIDEEAAQKLANAERLQQEVESQRDTLATELEAMRIRSRELAKHESEQMIAEAREHMARERATMKREALHIEQAQTAKIAVAVATATRDATRRLLEQLDGPELEQTLTQAACRELSALSNNSLAKVTVESAAPIDDAARQLILASLGKAAKTADFRVTPELKGGLRISTAHGLIDASIQGIANYAEQSISAEMESMIRENSDGE